MATSSCCVLSPPACNKSIVDIKFHIDKILYFLDSFGWLADVYVSDFFVCNYWKKLLPCWRSCFSQMNAPEIAEILSCEPKSNSRLVLPLSMLAYRQTIQSLSLKRTKASDEELTNLLSTLVKHVKPKKQHEIDQMSKVIGQLCQTIGCDRIVDIGAGLGHLSRLLNFKYGLAVTTVEASSGHAPKAQKYDLDLKNEIKKKKKKMESSQLTQSEIVQSAEFSDVQNFHPSTNTLSATTNTCIVTNTASTPTKEIITTATNCPVDASSLPCHIVYQVSNTISPGEFLQVLLKENTKSSEVSNKSQLPSAVTFMECSSNESTFSDEGTKFFNSQTESNCLIKDSSHEIEQNTELSTQKLTFSETSDYNKNGSSTVLGSNLPHSSVNCDQTCQKESILHTSTDKQPNDTMVLCGLHACGDLTATILRMFVQSPHIAAIASVGCCYMKLTGISRENEQFPESIGYPMSQYLLSKGHCLSYEAREMACHFVDAYRKRLLDDCPSLQRHWYRAALQVVLRTVLPDFKHGCVKLAIKNVENLSFEIYLEKALKYLGYDISDVPSDLIKKCKDTQNCWKEVVCFYTTRLSLAPVVETLLLLDRVLHLNELGFGCALVPIFEPMLSPRNFLLLAIKPSAL
ncbi:Protein RRNAD1 [Acanthosepion pharaonis]|uniref:Protein RRNAD1 n=1 Tax=Acanthosepion pharaonis TaxID=158019 RepID=A0A812EGZ2_ACAPH|nr:Protein RRNAD1 [Sepia pharaonis]